jgi:hypothetical protein
MSTTVRRRTRRFGGALDAYLLAQLIEVASDVSTGDHTLVIHFDRPTDRDGALRALRLLRQA